MDTMLLTLAMAVGGFIVGVVAGVIFREEDS